MEVIYDIYTDRMLEWRIIRIYHLDVVMIHIMDIWAQPMIISIKSEKPKTRKTHLIFDGYLLFFSESGCWI